MLLRLTDGTTTVTLHNDAAIPSAGLAGAVYMPRDPGDRETVAETARVVFDGATSSIRASLNQAEMLLRLAAEGRTRPALPRVYAEYRHGNSGTIMRSRLVGGRVTWSEDPTLRNLAGATAQGEAAVIMERLPFWEGAQETIGAGVIRNGSSSPYNRLALNAPSGTMPAPLVVSMTNSSGVSFFSNRFFLSVDGAMGLTGTQHLISGGSASWGAGLTHSTRLWTIPIPNDVIFKAKGAGMRALVAFSSLAAGDMYLKASLWSNFLDLLTPTGVTGGEVHIGQRRLINLGDLPIPPDGVSTSDLSLVISGYSPNAGSATIDFVHLTPSDRSLVIDQISSQFQTNQAHVEDSAEEQAYYFRSGFKVGLLRRSGGPLTVYPGRTASLYILFDEGGSYNSSRQLTVNVSYRPRYATI